MSTLMDILRVDLRTDKTDPESLEQRVAQLYEQEGLWFGWIVNGCHVEPDIACFEWDRSFIRDLVHLRDLGVRGHIILHGSEDEVLKYEVGASAVREYEARGVFRKRPSHIYRELGDVK